MEAVADKPTEKPRVKPTIGRIVHVWGPGPLPLSTAEVPYAGLIVGLRENGRVNIAAFNASGVPTARLNLPYSETPKAGHWTWPAKEKT